MRSIDKDPLYRNLLLGLPFTEGTGTVVHDIASPHHPITWGNTPAWTQLASGIWVLRFLSADNDYLSIPTAGCTDLDFTSGNFSAAIWLNRSFTGSPQRIMRRGTHDVSGWSFELSTSEGTPWPYFTTNQLGNSQSASGWSFPNTIWSLVGFSRQGSMGRMYINGVSYDDSSVLVDPASSADDFYIGEPAGSIGIGAYVGFPRIWGRALTQVEHRSIYNRERGLFGV